MANKKQDTKQEPEVDLNFDDIADFEEIDITEEAMELSELDELREENKALKDRLMRALAEAENQRKRGERNRRDAEIYGGTKLAKDMLSVYDNMSRALDAIDEDQRAGSKALIDGIELTKRELLSVFKTHKIETVLPAVGDKFNPQVHEAMFEAPVPDIKAGHIIQVLSQGFMIGDRLLRAAQVGVSSSR
ncbi:MAG: nucleotide exchange factor GrpE [Proteobacteria bacterium]|nr:nucleotide exchange factor GrpE [Pseudomonadota bacterium]